MRKACGILMIIVGAFSGFGFMIYSLLHAFSELRRFDTEGSHWIALDPGEYTVYRERPGILARRADPDKEVAVGITGSGVPNPRLEPVRLWASHYSTGSAVGVAIATFEVEREGVYSVNIGSWRGQTPLEGSVVISHALTPLGIVRLVFITLLLLGGWVAGGVTLLVSKRPTAAGA